MSEQGEQREPFFDLRYGDNETARCTPWNTTLYTFLGSTAVKDIEIDNECFNHVFIVTNPEAEDGGVGIYLFERFHDSYPQVLQLMAQGDYPMIINVRTVPDVDIKAYMNHVEAICEHEQEEIPDWLPDDF